MNTKLRIEAKNDFEKYFFKLMNNADFGKTMENVKKHRDIKLATTEPNYHATKYFSENLMAIEMKKLKLAKDLYMNFGMIILNQSIKAKQNYVTWILTAFHLACDVVATSHLGLI